MHGQNGPVPAVPDCATVKVGHLERVAPMKLVAGRYVDECQSGAAEPACDDLLWEGPGPGPARGADRWLLVGLVAALLVIAGLARWLYVAEVDRGGDRAVTDVVAANLDAWNRGDGAGVLATMTTKGTWSGQGDGSPDSVVGPLSGAALAEYVRSLPTRGFTVRAQGPATVTRGDGHWIVAQLVWISFRGPESLATKALYEAHIVDRAGTMLIIRVTWAPWDPGR